MTAKIIAVQSGGIFVSTKRGGDCSGGKALPFPGALFTIREWACYSSSGSGRSARDNALCPGLCFDSLNTLMEVVVFFRVNRS